MPNKPHKFGINYMGKDETRCTKSLGEFVTLKLAELYLNEAEI